MGGRGGSSGLGVSRESGFSYKGVGGKTTTVQRTSGGVVLVNGKPNNNVSYEKLRKSARQKSGYRELSSAELKKERNDRYESRSKVDYEMGLGTGYGNKDNRHAARVSRLTGRVLSRKR